MELEQAVRSRRSIRRFNDELFPESSVKEAFELAVLAPNSSNTQTWGFSWVRSPEKRQKLIEACLSQSAARTSSHLIVVSADPLLWKRSQSRLLEWTQAVGAPEAVITYYKKLVPMMYRWGLFNSIGLFKRLGFWMIGWFRPIMRGPCFRSDQEMVAVKSAALAAENFVLAITAKGGASCMMEGFDEVRVKKILGLSRTSRVVMVIAVGYEAEKGTWGSQWRLPLTEVVREV